LSQNYSSARVKKPIYQYQLYIKQEEKMSTAWKDLETRFFELKDFSWYVVKPDREAGSGLYSGDDVIIRMNYWIYAHNIYWFVPYQVKVNGQLDGITCSWTSGLGSGKESGLQDVKLVFAGKMPPGKDLSGKLTFYGRRAPLPPTFVPGVEIAFAEVPISIPNLDDIAPPPSDGVPPTVCTEGQERCTGYNREICQNSQWAVKEYNSPECGYTPEPICTNGEERCIGTELQVCVGDHWETKERNSSRCGYVPPDEGEPTPPTDGEGIGGWFDRNKTLIIAISATVPVISIIVLVTKTKVRSPVAAWPKFQPPIVRK
jgi:hypothetical protein